MILNSTYTNKENKQLLEGLVGKPFSLFESIKMKGVGSRRMIIENVSLNLTQYINKVLDINYANIQLRSKGLLIHINKGLKSFIWVITLLSISNL